MVHIEIQPSIAIYVNKCFLFDMDASFSGQYEPGQLFSVSSYPGEALTFQVVLNNGCMFSYLPIHALFHSTSIVQPQLELRDLLYYNCPDEYICCNYFEHLHGNVLVYFPLQDIWMEGIYLFTLDWYRKNENGHFIALQNGQFAIVPNHKIKFKNTERMFPAYRKLKQQWVWSNYKK